MYEIGPYFKFPKIDLNGRQCGVNCACSQGECSFMDHSKYPPVDVPADVAVKISLENVRKLRRRTDSQPGQSIQMRSALAQAAQRMAAQWPGERETLKLIAQTLERDEQNNAAMIHELTRAGYRDIPARVDATVIRRLLGYMTPGA